MGGSGGGGTTGGGGGSGGDCFSLIFEAVLASPDPAAISTLGIRDICDIALLSSPTRIAVLTQPTGAYAGAITNRWEDLVRCLGQGVDFEAEVLTTTPPVRVRVRPRR